MGGRTGNGWVGGGMDSAERVAECTQSWAHSIAGFHTSCLNLKTFWPPSTTVPSSTEIALNNINRQSLCTQRGAKGWLDKQRCIHG
eukprot:scaffold337345_cov20-Prasinocladus_malaysianus.AAC.1